MSTDKSKFLTVGNTTMQELEKYFKHLQEQGEIDKKEKFTETYLIIKGFLNKDDIKKYNLIPSFPIKSKYNANKKVADKPPIKKVSDKPSNDTFVSNMTTLNNWFGNKTPERIEIEARIGNFSST